MRARITATKVAITALVALALASSVVLAATSSRAHARHPAPKGAAPVVMRYACASKANGLMRYAARPSACSHRESRLDLTKVRVQTCVLASRFRSAIAAGRVHASGLLDLGATRRVARSAACGRRSYGRERSLTLPGRSARYFCPAGANHRLHYVRKPALCPRGVRAAVVRAAKQNAPLPPIGDSNAGGNNGNVVANPDSASTDEDHATSVNVLANDTVPGPGNKTLSVTGLDTTGTHGSVSLNSDQTIHYDPGSYYQGLNSGQTATDTFKYRATDGPHTSDPATVTITITGSDDAPVLSGVESSTLNYFEGTTPGPAVSSGISVTSADDALSGATVTIGSGRESAHDELEFTDQNGISGTYTASSGVLALTGSASKADYQAALRSVRFFSSSGSSTGDRSVSFKASSGSLDSNAVSRTVHVDLKPTAVNDSHTQDEDMSNSIDVLANDQNADGGPMTVDSVTQGGHGTVTNNSSNVDYTPAANYCGSDSFTYTLNGGSTATVSVTVNCVNDAPVNTVPGAQTTNEDTSLILSGANAPSVADVDAGNNNVKVTLRVSHGTLILGGTAGLTVTGNNSGSITATGTISNLNVGLDGMRYTPDANYNGSDTLTMDTDDQGNSGSGGAQTDSDTVGITVVAVNDPPVNSVPGTQTINEDTPLTLSGGNAPSISDVDAGTSDVKLNLDVSHGTLDLSGTSGLSVTGNGTDSIAATGSLTDLNTALNGLRYTPDANYNGSDTLTMKSDDQGNTGSGGAKTDSDSVTINVTAVDDGPVNSVPASVSTDEDNAFTFDSSHSLSVSDADADPDAISITLTATHGTATLGGSTSGLTSLSGNGTGTVTASGTVSALNTALANTVFTPDANYNGTDASLELNTNDDGHNGAGGPLTDDDIVAITVNAVNDPPVLTKASDATTDEDTPVTFSSSPTVVDPDSDPNDVEVSLSVAHGTLHLPSTVGITFQNSTTNDSASMIFRGSQSAVDGAMSGLQYTPDANYNGGDTLTQEVDDLGHNGAGGPLTDSHTSSITVNAVNDAPVVDLDTTAGGTGSTATFNEVTTHDNSVAVAPNAGVTDVDNADLTGGTITLTNRPDSTAESLSVDTTGTSINATVYDPVTGVITLSGTDSKANYAQVIQSLTYANTAGPPSSADRTIDVVVNDGSADSNTAVATMHVVPINVPPNLDLDTTNGASSDSSASFVEDSGAVAIAPNTGVTDSDNANMASATVTLTDPHDGSAESLDTDLTGTSGITEDAYNSSTGVLYLHGSATKGDYATALSRVKYDNSSQTPNTSDRHVSVQVNDGLANSPTRTATVSVAQHNDPPVVSVPGGQTIDEDNSNTFSSANGNAITVSDADAGSGTISLNLHVSDGTLTLGSTAGLSSSSGNGTDSVSISGSQSALTTALDGLTYTPDANFNGSDTLELQSNDNGNSGGPAATDSKTVGITVNAVNDPPVDTVPGAQSVNEDTPLTFSMANGNLLAVNDVDAGSSPVKVTLSADHGTITLSTTFGLSFSTGDGTSDATMTFTGTTTAINNALSGATYQGNQDYNGSDTLTLSSDDQGATGTGGAMTDSDSVAITVNPVNDPPAPTDKTFTGANSAVGNTTFVINDPTDGAPATPDPTSTNPASGGRPHKTVSSSIISGSTDVDGPGPDIVTGVGTDGSNGQTADGGTVTAQSDGDIVFEPKASTSCTDHQDSFKYTVSDQDPTDPKTGQATITVDIAGCVWYVDNNAPGDNGTSVSPFDSLSEAQTAAGTNADSIFVYKGSSDTTPYGGIALSASQKLIGEAADLTVGSDTLHSADSTRRPALSGSTGSVVALASGTAAKGLAVNPSGSAAGLAGTGFTNATTTTLDNLTVGASGSGAGLNLDTNNSGAATNVSNLAVASSSNGTGIRLNSAGTVNFADSGTITSSSTSGKALDATSTSFGSGSVFDSLSTSGSSSGGVNLTSTTGTVALGGGSGTDLDLTTTSGSTPALNVSGASNVTVPSGGTANVVATGGPAVNITGAGSGSSYSFDKVSSVNSAGDGVDFSSTAAVPFSADSTGSISGQAGTGFSISGGTGTVSYAGAFGDPASTGKDIAVTGRSGGAIIFSGNINDTSSSGGGGISVTSNSGGSTTFSGSTKKVDSAANDGVHLASNTGHTIDFTGGGLDVDTSSGAGFTATGGGTVDVTGTGNSINSTSATALNVSSTTIGANNMTFQSISSGNNTAATDPASGISLNNTGTSGSLSVTGIGSTTQGGDSSGGTIQRTSGPGISLNTTKSPSFNDMMVDSPARAGVRGTLVDGFSMTNSTVQSAGVSGASVSAPLDYALSFNDTANDKNIQGALTVNNNKLLNDWYGGLKVLQHDGTITDAQINNNQITQTAADQDGDGIGMNLNGTSSTAASLTKATISNNTLTGVQGSGIQLLAGNSSTTTAPNANLGTPSGSTPNAGTNIVTINSNTMVGNAQAGTDHSAMMNGNAVLTGVDGRGAANVTITNNTAQNFRGAGIGTGGSGDGTQNYNVTGNAVTPNDTNDNNSIGIGVAVDKNTQADSNVLDGATVNAIVSNNTVSNSEGFGFRAIGEDSNTTLNVRSLNNNVSAPTNHTFPSMEFDSGSGSDATRHNTACYDVASNTAAAGSAPDSFGNTTSGIVMRERTGGALKIVGLTPSPATAAQTETFEAGKNPASGAGSAGFDSAKVAVFISNSGTADGCTLPF